MQYFCLEFKALRNLIDPASETNGIPSNGPLNYDHLPFFKSEFSIIQYYSFLELGNTCLNLNHPAGTSDGSDKCDTIKSF